jgi:hypothetical protein
LRDILLVFDAREYALDVLKDLPHIAFLQFLFV